MYVYYQSYRFPGAIYTHRITVHENPNGRLREVLEAKYGSKAVTWNKRTKRLYVRETMRIARVHKNKTRTTQTRKYGEWNFATVKNYALNIIIRVDMEAGAGGVSRLEDFIT